MFLLHRSLPALFLLCLASCSTVPKAPAPDEFSLTPEELGRKYPQQRQMGIVSLYGAQITPGKDAQGREVQTSIGGALLVKKSSPAISVKAPEIVLNADHAEARGRFTLQKADQIHVGESESSKVVIDGVQLRFEGPHSLKKVGAAKPAAAEPTPPPATTKPEVQTEAQPEVKPAPKPRVQRSKPAAPQPKPKPSIKPTPAAPKPAPVDRSKLLQLMREPE